MVSVVVVADDDDSVKYPLLGMTSLTEFIDIMRWGKQGFFGKCSWFPKVGFPYESSHCLSDMGPLTTLSDLCAE